jgi:glutaredoxin 3
MYSKDYCPFCKAAKNLLSSKGLEFETIDVLEKPDRLQEMIDLSKRRTVPQIFFGEQHIGGYDDLLAYYETINKHNKAA